MSQSLIDDALWSRIEPLLPKPPRRRWKTMGRPRVPDRTALTAILFVLRSGLPWQMLLKEMGCGSGSTCWRRLARRQRAGVWRLLHVVLLAELRQRGQLDLPRAIVDSGSVLAEAVDLLLKRPLIMTISILVSTYNRCEKLKLLLRALKSLYLSDAVECEVLVLDNNSTDFTAQVAADYLTSERPVFRYILEERPGKSHALNTGISVAEGDILVFTDDDCIPDPHWIESIIKEFGEDPSLSVLGGRVDLYEEQDRPHSISLSHKRTRILCPKEVCRQPMIMGNNMAIRRNAFGITAEFDPLLGPGSICRAAEDIEFLYRLYTNGCKMVYSPNALVFHKHGRKTEAEDDAVSYSYGMGRGALYVKHILRLDFNMLGIACDELYSLGKTLLKGFIVRENFHYHKLTVSALFVGAFYYCTGSVSRRGGLRGKPSMGAHS